MRGKCLNCGFDGDIGVQIAGTILTPLATGFVGANTIKNPWVTAALTLAAFWVGRQIDNEIQKKCPQCGAVLAIIEPLI